MFRPKLQWRRQPSRNKRHTLKISNLGGKHCVIRGLPPIVSLDRTHILHDYRAECDGKTYKILHKFQKPTYKALIITLTNIITSMATFKSMIRTPRKDGFYQVCIRVVHNTKPGYLKTDKVVTAKQLDKHGDITDPFVNSYCSQQILNYAERLNRLDISSWSVKQVIDFHDRERGHQFQRLYA